MLAVGLVLCSSFGLVYGVGHVLTTNVDGTVLVDNPERPPETSCDGGGDPPGFDEDVCEEPRQVERNVDPIIDRATGEVVGSTFVGMLLVLVGFTLVVHVGSWLAGGSNGLGASLAVTPWGMTPVVVVAPVSVVVLSMTLDAASDPAGAFAELEARLGSVGWLGTISSIVSAVWSGVVWRFGLEHRRDLPGGQATPVAAVTALLLVAGGAL